MRTSTQQSPRSGSASPHPLAKTRIPEVWFSRVKEQLARTHSSIACEGCLSLLRRGKTRLEVYRAFGAGGAVFALFLLTKRRERKTFSSPLLAAKVEQNCQPELTKTMLRAVSTSRAAAELALLVRSDILTAPGATNCSPLGWIDGWRSCSGMGGLVSSRCEEIVLLRKYSILGAAT